MVPITCRTEITPLTILDITTLTIAAFFTSALTAVAGAGGGAALMAIMLQFMPPVAAIPVHGAVHLVSNITRCWLLWRHMSWPIIIRFAIPLPFGAVLGLWLFQGLSIETVQILIGAFVLLSLVSSQMQGFGGKELPLWGFVPVGFGAGILNMIVGAIAPILGVFVIRKDLTKENVVATLGFFGVVANIAKVTGFTVIGFSFVAYGPAVLCMIPAVIIGTRVGRALLHKVDERLFLLIFKIILMVLGLKLILVDGMGLLDN
ncbi:MAG: hypothetical protein CMM48_11625 [Rhodospirillaceae bacterium]|nr:hypothetical protein [Rhodospirillaceae bacterium]HAA91593.1 hypothetical protein [Rhodospirillaceae bacterium]